MAAWAAEVTSEQRKTRKVREGLVVSDKMNKTVVVSVEDRRKHARYGTVMRHTARLKAHDENNEFKPGDMVWIEESKPISKLKRWTVVRGEQKKSA